MKCTDVRIKNVLTKAKISTVGQTGSMMVTYNRCDFLQMYYNSSSAV